MGHSCRAPRVCLSRGAISKEGYLQKELKQALDVSDEKPEGTVYIVPVRLEPCAVPERLSRWQWIDVYEEHGVERLLAALAERAKYLGPCTVTNLPGLHASEFDKKRSNSPRRRRARWLFGGGILVVGIGILGFTVLYPPNRIQPNPTAYGVGQSKSLPSPAPQAQGGGTLPLGVIVDSTSAVNSAALAFGQKLSAGGAPQSTSAGNPEKEQLKQVIRDLVSIEYSQAPLPTLLRNYVRGGDFSNWDQVKAVLAANTALVADLADLMAKFDGDLVYRDLETYRQLRMIVSSRSGMYGELARMEPPPSQQEKQQLLKIADNFDVLIREMKAVQKNLSTYLKE